MTAKAILTGTTHVTLNHLFREATLRGIYSELRKRQEELLDEVPQPSDEEDDWEEDPIQLSDFEDQIAIDVELLEGVVNIDSVSEELLLQQKQLLALTAIITDSMVRYDYDEEQLVDFMFNLMGVRD